MRRTAHLVVVGLMIAAVMGTAKIIVAQTVDSDATSTPAFSVSDDTLATSTNSDSATTTSEIATSTSTVVGTTTPDLATSTPPVVPLTCTMAYTSDLYDTASGHAAAGATVIGTQSWTDCNDGRGHTYEFKISPTEYAAMSAPGAIIPQKSTADSYQPVPKYSVPDDTDSTTTITNATTTVMTTADPSQIMDGSTPTTTPDASITNDTATTTPEEPAETETTTSTTTPDANSPPSESLATTTATTTTQ